MLLSTQLLQRESFGVDLTVSGSTNSNKLLTLGGTPPQINVTTRVVEGYPLFGLWAQKIQGWEDKNGDGILTYNANASLNEVFVDSVYSFIGYTQPRHNITTTGGVDLFRRMLRVQAMFDWRGGHYWYNNTERIRCQSRGNCNGLMIPPHRSRSRHWWWPCAIIHSVRSPDSCRRAISCGSGKCRSRCARPSGGQR